MDWQEQLGNLRASLPEGADVEQPQQERRQEKMPLLDIVFERKGRCGKSATIICGFECEESRVKEIASQLKKSLATGGSVRGGEILVQGDRRRDVLDALTKLGLKARII